MSDVYHQLAKALDALPQGFPSTDNGVEIKILQKLYRPQDAEIARQLTPRGETAQQLAERLNKEPEEMRGILDDMAKRGQIGSMTFRQRQYYRLSPFLPGIYEYQVYRLDKELVEMFEEYLPTLVKSVGGYEPGVARTIPVNTSIETGKQVHTYEDTRVMIEDARSFLVIDCICRKERDIEGHTCSHTMENCLQFSREENAFEYFRLGGRTISKQQAVDILKDAGEEGLVHNAFYNVKDGHGAICNCCSCCCAVLRGMKDLGAPHMAAKSNFMADIDADECNMCGICADERCPMDAIIEEDSYVVQPHLCIGCGVCTVTCPTEAITMISRPESDQTLPPNNMSEWASRRQANRMES